MTKLHNPDTISAPSSAYAHGVETPSSFRRLHISGQVGEKPDGTLAGDTSAQMIECWNRIFAILDAADMSKKDLVKVTVFLTNREEIGIFRAIRDKCLDGHITASSLIIVAGLAKPEWTVEIEAIAEAQ